VILFEISSSVKVALAILFKVSSSNASGASAINFSISVGLCLRTSSGVGKSNFLTYSTGGLAASKTLFSFGFYSC
jgi:hypothetical protein